MENNWNESLSPDQKLLWSVLMDLSIESFYIAGEIHIGWGERNILYKGVETSP